MIVILILFLTLSASVARAQEAIKHEGSNCVFLDAGGNEKFRFSAMQGEFSFSVPPKDAAKLFVRWVEKTYGSRIRTRIVKEVRTHTDLLVQENELLLRKNQMLFNELRRLERDLERKLYE